MWSLLLAIIVPAALGFIWLGRMQGRVEDLLRDTALLQAEHATMKATLGVVETRQLDVRERLSIVEKELRVHELNDAKRFDRFERIDPSR